MHRRKTRRQRKKQRKIIIVSSFVMLFALSIGYSAFQTNITLNAKGNIKKYKTASELGYVTNGLQVAYDSIVGFSDDKKYWIDISNNNRNGKLKNFDNTDISDGLKFDGIDDYVLMDEMNYENVTMQIVLKYDKFSVNGYTCSFSNFETGGYGFSVDNQNMHNNFDVFLKDYGYLPSSETETVFLDENNKKMDNVLIDKKYFLSGSYDNNTLVLYENDHKYSIDKVGTIGYTHDSTHVILGGNPAGSTLTGSLIFSGKIYSVRMYNRALTDNEVIQNYNIDKQRFNIE